MALAARMTGGALKVYFVTAGGTADLSGDYRSLSVTRQQETVDASAGNDTARAEIAALKTFAASLETTYIGTAGSAAFALCTLGATGTLQYYPLGTATGSPRGAIPVIVQDQTIEFAYDDMTTVTIEFGPFGAEIWNPLTDKA